MAALVDDIRDDHLRRGIDPPGRVCSPTLADESPLS